jgi:hypothetical protein
VGRIAVRGYPGKTLVPISTTTAGMVESTYDTSYAETIDRRITALGKPQAKP